MKGLKLPHFTLIRHYCVKTFTKAEVSKHSKSTDCWMIIEDKVYDVTKFIDEHPGGDVILDVSTLPKNQHNSYINTIFQDAGADATDNFIGKFSYFVNLLLTLIYFEGNEHSQEARQLLKQYYIGDLKKE